MKIEATTRLEAKFTLAQRRDAVVTLHKEFIKANRRLKVGPLGFHHSGGLFEIDCFDSKAAVLAKKALFKFLVGNGFTSDWSTYAYKVVENNRIGVKIWGIDPDEVSVSVEVR